MSKLQSQVREFMTAFGQHIESKPTVPSDDVVRLRARLVVEECFEMLEAMYNDDRLYWVEQDLMYMLRESEVRVDMVELSDAFGDLDYVVEGSRLAFGIDGEPIADAIHASNMAKAGGYADEHGKWRKPADWKAPDILGELRKQGWAE